MAARKQKSFNFIEDDKGSNGKKMVSVRVDANVYDSFHKAASVCTENGKSLKLTTVVQKALMDAVQEVEQVFKVDCKTVDMKLTSKPAKKQS